MQNRFECQGYLELLSHFAPKVFGYDFQSAWRRSRAGSGALGACIKSPVRDPSKHASSANVCADALIEYSSNMS